MSQYKVRRTHSDWFSEDSAEHDERFGALVEDLDRRLIERKAFADIFLGLPHCQWQYFSVFSAAGYMHAEHAATDVALEASKPGYGVWLRVDAERNPLAALAGFGRAACRRPWYMSDMLLALV